MAPRVLVTPLTRRVQTTPEHTYDVTTPSLEVTAYPVDPYARPQVSSGLRNLIQALGPVSQALRAYGQELDRRYQEEIEQGRLARASGKPKPSQSEAQIRGWEELDGKLTARRDYRAEVTEFLAQNMDVMAPEEIEQGLQEIAQKYLNGATDNFIRGFVEVALGIEDAAIAQYVARQQELIREQSFNKLAQHAEDEARSIVEGIALPLFRAGSLDDLVGNVEVYETLNRANFGVIFADQLNKGLDAAQELGASLGFSKGEITELYLDRVGALAIELGMPELLDWTEKRDEEGVSVAGGALADKVRRYRQEAERARTSYIQAAERLASQERERQQTIAVNQLRRNIATLYTIDNPVEAAKGARELRELFTSDPMFQDLSPTLYNAILNDLIDIELGQYQFPSIGNEHVFADLRLAAVMNELTLEDILAARAENDLTLSQFNTLLQDYEEQERRKQDEAYRWPDSSAIMDLQDTAIALIVGLDEFGLFQDYTLAMAAKKMFRDEIDAFRQQHGRNPTYKEYTEQILEPVLSANGISLRELMKMSPITEPPSILTEQPPQPVMSEPRELTVPQRIVNWVRENILGLEPLYVQGEPEVLEPGARYAEEEAWDLLNLLFEQEAQKKDIEEVLLEMGESERAVDFYFRLYAYNFAKTALETYDNPIAAIRFITRSLRQFGFSDAEIQEGINAARFRGEVTQQPNGSQ